MTVEQVRAEPRDDRRRCPLCFDDLAVADAARACDACGTAYHRACFDELGGCGTAGCARAARRGPAPAGRVEPWRPAPPPDEGQRLSPYGPLGGAALSGLLVYVTGSTDLTVLALALLLGAVLGFVGEALLPPPARRRAQRRAMGFAIGAIVGIMLALLPFVVLAVARAIDPTSPLAIGALGLIAALAGVVGAVLEVDA